jgi:hypothetical protein
VEVFDERERALDELSGSMTSHARVSPRAVQTLHAATVRAHQLSGWSSVPALDGRF